MGSEINTQGFKGLLVVEGQEIDIETPSPPSCSELPLGFKLL